MWFVKMYLRNVYKLFEKTVEFPDGKQYNDVQYLPEMFLRSLSRQFFCVHTDLLMFVL